MPHYVPQPTGVGATYDCLGCDVEIDGTSAEGFWLEREQGQVPNRYELYCLSCCVEKMNNWANHPDVTDEAVVKAHFTSETE